VLVLSAALMHAGWNALLRGGADRGQSMLIMNITVGLAGLAMLSFAGLPSAASAPYVIASGLLHLIYNALLVLREREQRPFVSLSALVVKAVIAAAGGTAMNESQDDDAEHADATEGITVENGAY